MRASTSLSIGILYLFIATLASFSGLKIFEAWEQVSRLWETAVNPFEILWHPHMPRFLVAYPAFMLEELLPRVGFSLYINCFFVFNIILLRKIAILSINQLPSIATYIIFTSIHLGMNGRGVIAWFAWLMCIWICLKITTKSSRPASQILLLAVSSLFATVSTGVFIVVILAFTFVIIFHVQFLRRVNLLRAGLIALIVAPIAYFSFKFFLLAIEKNIEFYGGGIEGFFNMLEHGLGLIFRNFELMNILFSWFFILCFIFLVFYFISVRRFPILDQLIALAIVCGFFGFTVLTLSIPLLLLRMQNSLYIIKFKNYKKRMIMLER